eukprot:CAMPEP_0115832084 /NCGR_PEP_ID=MMETSP0287-20121206/2474_1 /TAXON_ID=412157 /ORGANISM="Chrysochromulina rotalis, Strain UIO044" /LENGTH=154 /DNA_ID=CAMNT_0003285455 /DNA_START=95 /DNA_END=559 /DNA_ORIENTATION=-
MYGTVVALDVKAMQEMMAKNDKVILLLHAGDCSRAQEFAPTMEKIALQLSMIPFGIFDVKSDKRVTASFATGIQPEAPALKAMFRNAPPGKRMLEYRGPPTFDAVFAWAQAVADWDGSDQLAPGWEVGHDYPDERAQRKPGEATAGSTRGKDEV